MVSLFLDSINISKAFHISVCFTFGHVFPLQLFPYTSIFVYHPHFFNMIFQFFAAIECIHSILPNVVFRVHNTLDLLLSMLPSQHSGISFPCTLRLIPPFLLFHVFLLFVLSPHFSRACCQVYFSGWPCKKKLSVTLPEMSSFLPNTRSECCQRLVLALKTFSLRILKVLSQRLIVLQVQLDTSLFGIKLHGGLPWWCGG